MKGGRGMRLINADNICNIEDFIVLHDGNAYISLANLCKLIDIQPTAFNVNEVINDLKKCYGIVNSCSIDYAEGLKDAYERAIDIVKLGINKEGD